MKRLAATLLALLLWLGAATPALALQEDIPSLVSIAFYGATVNEAFSPEVREYTLTLEDTAKVPTLKSYEVSGSAELFITYEQDAARHQTGVLATLRYEGGSNQYRFTYANAAYDSTSGNNYLKDILCENGEVYPAVSESLTKYRLYIPKDATELNLRPITQEVGAVCDFPETVILAADQEPLLTLTVTAANGETRAYTLQVKRLENAPEQGEGFLKEILLYRNPALTVAVAAAAGGLVLLGILLMIFRRITVKAEDADEPSFFD